METKKKTSLIGFIVAGVLLVALVIVGVLYGYASFNLAQREADILELNSVVAAKESEIEGKNTEIEGLNADLEGKNTEIESLNTDLEGKNTEIESLNADLEGKNSEIEALNADLLEKDSQINGLSADLEGKKSEIDGLNASLAGKNTEIEGLNAALSNATAKGGAASYDIPDSVPGQTSSTRQFLYVLEQAGIRYSYEGVQQNDYEIVTVNDSGYVIRTFFDLDGEHASFRVWDVIKFNSGDKTSVIKACNSLNTSYKYICFEVDDDNTVTIAMDMVFRDGDNIGDSMLEALLFVDTGLTEGVDTLGIYGY